MATLASNRSGGATVRPQASIFSANTHSSSGSSKKGATIKYGTVAGDKSSKLKRPTVLGAFESAPNGVGGKGQMEKDRAVNGGHPPLARSGTALGFGSKNAGETEEGEWTISLVERKVGDKHKGKGKKDVQPVFTLYVTTPTSNLTLARSVNQLAELDAKLRSQLPDRMPSSKPTLLDGPWSAIASPSRGRNVLQTLSRTLAPTKRANLNRLSFLPSPPTSPAKQPVASQTHGRGKGHSHGVSVDAVMPLSAPAGSPSAADRAASAHDPSTITKLGGYLTECARSPVVRRTTDWTDFFKVGSEDLESVRVEKRIKRVRSDVASHLSPDAAADLSSPGDGVLNGEHQGSVDRKDTRPIGTDPVSVQAATVTGLATPASTYTTESVDPSDVEVSSTSQSGLPSASAAQPLTSSVKPVQAKKRSRSVKTAADRKVTTDDYELMRVLGKGCAGKVLLVRHKASKNLYAMKAIHKHHVLAHRELQHTLTEQSVLKTVAKEQTNPFVVRLWWSFHDAERLFLVMDFHPGGDLATQLARWGRLGKDRARFYAAEIVEGVEGLHNAGVIYRDLKPENILIAADGHCILTDFGLSKQFIRADGDADDTKSASRPSWMPSGKGSTSPGSLGWWSETRETTSTFCGTAEYLAPEVLLGEPYSFEVDWWSYGTMLYEMLTGLTPFWNEDHSIMYRRVLHEELSFNDDVRVLDQDTKSILRGLLQKNPALRMTHKRIKRHPYFSMIDWTHVHYKRYIPPYIPTLDPLDDSDTQNFDDTFLNMAPQFAEPEDEKAVGGSETRPPSGEPQNAVDEHGRDVFDGYSYLGHPQQEPVEEEGDDFSDGDVEHHEPDGESHLSSLNGSTRPTSVERETSAGRSKDTHGRDLSSGTNSSGARNGAATHSNLVGAISDVDETDDEDWDLVEASEFVKMERNGRRAIRGQGASLVARGVVDKYRLRIARIGKKREDGRPHSRSANISRADSRMSSRSSFAGDESATDGALESPRPSSRLLSSRLPSSDRLRFRPKRSKNDIKSASPTNGSPVPRDLAASPVSAHGLPQSAEDIRRDKSSTSKTSSEDVDDNPGSSTARKGKRRTINNPLNLFAR